MSGQFQFSLRGLMMSVTTAAVIAWASKVIGVGTAIGLLLVLLGLWAVSRRPLVGGIALLAVTSAALCGGLIYDGYHIQLHAVDSVLAEFPEIDDVWLCTNDDVTLEVEGLWFSTVDQPGIVFGIDYGIDGASKSEIRRRLRQVLQERRPVELPARATYRLR
jgi:hypothetical protein